MFARKAVFFAIIALLALPKHSLAQTWNGLGGNDNWQTNANWLGGVAPVNNGTANISFAGTTRLTPNVDVVYSINSLIFNNTSGAFTIGGSALALGAGGITNNDADMQTINSSININASQNWGAVSGPLTFNSLMSINSSNVLTFSTVTGNSIISGGISGTGSLQKIGSGTLSLGGGANNPFSGALTVNAGTVIFNKTAGLRAFGGALVIGDGIGVDTVQYSANNQSSLPSPIINSSGLLDLNGFKDTYQNLTMNGGGVTLGAGTLTIASNLTMTGGSISGTGVGLLVAQGFINTNAAASSAIISGSLDLQGSSHNFTIADGAAPADMDISASIGNGIINKLGAGTLRLSGTNDNGPSTQISVTSGTVEFAKTGGAIAGSVFVAVGDFGGGLNADIVRYLGNQQLDPATSISVNPAGLLDLNGFNQDVAHVTLTGGNISTGTGSLVLLDGPGIATTISGQTATLAGHLNLTNGTKTITVADGAATVDFDISAAIETATPATGGLTKNGTGTMRMSGGAPNNYGETFINQGILLLGKTISNSAIPDNLHIGSGTNNVAFVRLEQNEQIADKSVVTISSGSLLDLNGHAETITALAFPDGGGTVSTSAGTLTLLGDVSSTPANASNAINGNLNLAFNSHTFTIQDAGGTFPDLGVHANIFNGFMTKNGSGELGLYGNNNIGSTVLNDGTLLAGSNLAFGTGTLFLNGGILAADNGDQTLSNSVVINGSATISGQFNLTLTGAVSGTGNLTKSGSNVLSLPAGTSIAGAWTLAGGVLLSSNLAVAAHGSLTMNNGVFSGVLNNSGTFTYNNGLFNGQLINHGTVIINNSFFSAGVGITNFADMTLDNGLFLTTSGLTNNGQINLNGASIDLSNTGFNNGGITGFGAIGGSSQFFNTGLITQAGGNLTLNANGGQVNSGTIDLAAGRQLMIQNQPLSNQGTINLNGAIVALGTPLFNGPTGTVAGRGTIQTSFSNNGLLLVQGGTTNITNAWASVGTIQLAGVGSSLIGGKVTSSGTIQGSGAIGSDVDSSGTIEAIGGTLIFSGSVNNSGTIAATTGNKVLIAGLNSNTGIINLTGGTFDNNGFLVANTGQISGYGTFRAAQFTNNGSMTFSGGVSTINGSVLNAAGHQIRVAYSPAIFTGNVTNNGIFKSTSTTVTFAGTYTENGTFISDPADNFFNDVNIGPSGAWVGGEGDRFFISGNLTASAPSPHAWETSRAELHFLGASDHLLSIVGEDRGISFDGYANNFSWGTLDLAASTQLTLLDGNATPGGALYVHQLLLAGGLDQINSISSNGLNIYYDLSDSSNTYLQGQTYKLPGGGQISPVPEPGTLGVTALSLFILIRRRRKSCALVVQPHYSESSSSSFSPSHNQRSARFGTVAA